MRAITSANHSSASAHARSKLLLVNDRLSAAGVGGLVGVDSGVISNSFWDTQGSGQSTSAGGTGKTTSQMKQQATFTGWDFTDTWGIFENKTYPLLKSLPLCIQSGFPPGDQNGDCLFNILDFVFSAQFWLEDWVSW